MFLQIKAFKKPPKNFRIRERERGRKREGYRFHHSLTFVKSADCHIYKKINFYLNIFIFIFFYSRIKIFLHCLVV